LIKNEKGISLIEVLIALAIMALVAVAFLSGLTTASKALIIADERTTAESLARTQMEAVKAQPYQPAPDGGVGVYDKIEDIPDGFAIYSLGRGGSVEEDIVGVPWFFPLQQDPEPPNPGYAIDEDADCQKIRLVVKHGAKEIFTFIEDDKKITLEDYKVNR